MARPCGCGTVAAFGASFRPIGPPASDPVVVFCGVMDYGPNADAVRWFHHAVWPLVRTRHPAARFVVVGGGTPPDLAALLTRDSSVTVTGRVDRVQPHLWNAAVSVAPLQVARGVQNKVLEALAAGLPAVVTPAVFEGLPDEARPGCRTDATPAGFAAAICDLLTLSPNGRRLEAARANLELLSWQARLARLNELLEAAARRRRAS